MKVLLEIYANRGYGSDQIKGMTIGELKEMLESYDDDLEIVTHDESNRYGASYGQIRFITEDYEEDGEEDW